MKAPSNHHDEMAFENDVRRVARELWPEAEYGGASVVNGRERDGIFETEDCLHLLEVTVSRSKAKALEDVNKLTKLARQYQVKFPRKAVKCWFVTKDEPTADQRDVAKKHDHLVYILSFSQFQGQLINIQEYLTLRERYPFGSVRDPATGDQKTAVDYVTLDLIDTSRSKLWSVSSISEALLQGNRFVVLGDYGAGKSMTLREIYKQLRQSHFKHATTQFPIYLNLRDHLGQVNPAEVLERHARNLGFSHPSHLVRAWRGAYVILLVDGFDEITTLGIQGLWKTLQDSRFRAMQGVRELVSNHPSDRGIVLAGRAHFFDSERERRNALGLSPNDTDLSLNEFTAEQVQQYLLSRGLAGLVPTWMPSRPLLVGYLAASGLLRDTSAPSPSDAQGPEEDPASAWDALLDKICAREAQIDAGIDGLTVRRILEHLATMARTKDGGLGPLSPADITSAFVQTCGYQPDDRAMVLLQRLPGLGIERLDEDTRVFIDEGFADTCRAGDVVAFIGDPYTTSEQFPRGAEYGLGSLGVGVGVIKTHLTGTSSGQLNAALRKADNDGLTVVAYDVARIAIESGSSIDINLRLSDITVPSLELCNTINDCSKLSFRDCYFSTIELDPDLDATRLPRFESCYVGEVDGRSSRNDLPEGVFDENCVFDVFTESPDTTDAIGAMDLPLGVKVMLTVLRKIYLQGGAGRKENALHRGLDHHGRRLVGPVLRLLQGEGLISEYKRGGLDMKIWVPDRTKTSRVGKIITSPRTCGDPILQRASDL